MKELYENQENVVPLIWQWNYDYYGSPGYPLRAELYNVEYLPTCRFGGSEEVVGTTSNMYNTFLPIYNQVSELSSPLEIEISLDLGNENSLELEVDVLVTEAIETANNRILFIITNNYSDSYFSSVILDSSEDFLLTETGEAESFSTSFTLSEELELEDLSVAVLVQTMDGDKAILGARYYSVNELLGSGTDENELPQPQVQLSNYPNPFNPVTTISFSNQNAGPVAIEVYNAKGQMIKTLVNKEMEAGSNSVIWNGTDDSDHPVSSGIYFYKMETNSSKKIRKMLLMK